MPRKGQGRQIRATQGKSFVLGNIPKGCALCIRGQKLVLFTTGLCPKRCWYCTVSKNRWQKDRPWANERPVKKDDEILDEARLCRARGAGITGGEPLLKIDRTIHYIRLLKENFSSRFQIHLYTGGFDTTPEKALKRLNAAGLDELRIHLNKNLVGPALALSGWDVGMEVPVIPGQLSQLKNLARWLDERGAQFLNLNEMEFSDRNVAPMTAKRLKLKKGLPTAVSSSERTAKNLLEWAKKNTQNLNTHYCTAALKLDYQLRNRLRNRALSIKRPFEKITDDGMLSKGAVYGDRRKIVLELKKLQIPRKMFSLEKRRVETSVAIAKKIARFKKFSCAAVREYPSWKPWDVESTPL